MKVLIYSIQEHVQVSKFKRAVKKVCLMWFSQKYYSINNSKILREKNEMGKFENTFIGFFLFPLLSSINHCRYIHNMYYNMYYISSFPMRQCCVYWKVGFKVKGWRNQMSNEGQLLFYPHLDLAAMCLPKKFKFSTNCWKVRTCKYLLPSSCSSQRLRTTRSRNWCTRRCFCFFYNFAHMQAAERHISMHYATT